MKMSYQSLLFFLLIFTSGFAQVGVGTNTPAAALDITATDAGVLVPRVALTSKIVAAPVLNPQGGALIAGTLVWNTATAGIAPNNVVPGFYYWDGAAWIAFTGVASNNWTINGNTGTVAGTNYLGTTDAQDIRFKTQGNDKFNIGNTSGQFSSYSLGSITAPTYTWNSDLNTGIFSPSADVMGFTTNGTEKFRIPNANQVHAMSLGTAALPFYSYSADPDTGIFSAGADILNLSTAGVERVRVEADGDVGIGVTPSASAKLEISATDRGLLIPRVALTAKNVAAPVTAPTTSLLVYNTAIAGASPNNVIPGFYYWNGAAWVAFTGANSNDWSITGNSGTTAANYVGTSDAVALKLSTVGTERMRLLTNSQVVINNTGAPFASDQFSVYSTADAVNGYTTGAASAGAYFESTGAGGYGAFTVSNTALGIGTYGTSSGNTGTGIFGNASGAGGVAVWGQTTGTNAAAVWGTANAVGSDGVYGQATTATDNGVWGVNNNATGTGVFGTSTGTTGIGIYGIGTGTTGTGVYGESTQPGRPGVFGRNNNATGIGTYGTSTGATGIGVYGATNGANSTGVYGTSTGTSGTGVYGENNQPGRYGVWGVNNNATGIGTIGSSTGATGIGSYGSASGATGIGIYGYSTGATGIGVYGRANSANAFGVQAVNQNATGTAIIGGGNNVPILYSPPTGGGAGFTGTGYGSLSIATDVPSGIGFAANGNNITTVTSIAGGAGSAFSGNRYGIQSFATITGAGNDAIDRATVFGRYVSGGATTDDVYLGARIGGVNYKVFGTGGGSVSTTMPTASGERILFAPEAPENWFFDIGEVQLVNGKAKVKLDPIFVECISDSKPFKVFVQGGENTMGSIRITRDQDDKSFIVEDLGGASNGTVQYNVYAIWKGKDNLRFPEYKRPETIQTLLKGEQTITTETPRQEAKKAPEVITAPEPKEVKQKNMPQRNPKKAQKDLEAK